MDTNFEATSLSSLVGLTGNSGSSIGDERDVIQADHSLASAAMLMMNVSEEEELKLLNFPPKQEDLSTAIPLTVIFALLLVTGCIGNLCTAIVIARPKNKYMHTATNYYLFSLAMSDFLFLILGLPQEMYTLWQRYPYAFGECFCIIRSYFSEASTYASILTISAFTVERYVAICHPLWAHTMSQLPRAITSIVIIWIVSAICAIPPAAELGIVTQKGPITNRTLEESAQCASKNPIYENLFVISAIVFFIVPMIIVTVLYILIAIELRRSSRMNSAISKQSSSQLMQNGAANHQHQALISTNTRMASLAAMQAASRDHPSACGCCCCYHLNKQQQQQQQRTSFASNRPQTPLIKMFPAVSKKEKKEQQERPTTRIDRLNWNWISSSISPKVASSQHNKHLNQQPMSCNISPSSSLCLSASNQIQATAAEAAVPQVIHQQQQHSQNSSAGTILAAVAVNATAAAAAAADSPAKLSQQDANGGDNSLMASLKNQRPSSAIGNERRGSPSSQLNNGGGGGKRLWPIVGNFWMMGPSTRSPPPSPIDNNNSSSLGDRNSFQQQQLCQHCQLHQQPLVPNHPMLTLTSSIGSQFGAHPNSLIEQQQQPYQPAMSPSGRGTRNHSPLSYHESLIERHHQTTTGDGSGASCATNNNNNNNKLMRPQHQLSLTHSSQSIATSHQIRPATAKAHHLNHHHHPHQHHPHHHHTAYVNNHHLQNHHHQQQQQQQQQHHHQHHHQNHHHHHQNQVSHQQSRRSMAASSKKSVVRMLVAVVVSFFICWVPFHAQRLLASYLTKADNQNQVLLDIYHKLNYISGVTYYLSSTINPLLYQLMSAKFRLAFKETFNCSLFRFFSCCLSANPNSNSNPNTMRHSPTNSLKEGGTGTGHHHSGQYSASCCGAAKFKRIDSRASQLGSVIGRECSATYVPTSSDNATAQANNIYHECSLDLSGQTQQQYVNSHGMVARLRGKLKNSSLVSLFRASQDNLAFFGLGGGGGGGGGGGSGGCPCCIRHNLSGGQLRETTAHGNEFFDENRDQSHQRGGIHYHPSREDSLGGQMAVSTPLLVGENDQQQQHQFPNKTNNNNHFPAHSMLKFIRSPTPVVGMAASLTRLSSREDDGDNENDDANANVDIDVDIDVDVDEVKENNMMDKKNSRGTIESESQLMDSLIKATRDDNDEQGDLSEQNASILLTSGESAGPSGSSQSSSPEQQMLIQSETKFGHNHQQQQQQQQQRQKQQQQHQTAGNDGLGRERAAMRGHKRVKKLSSCSNSTAGSGTGSQPTTTAITTITALDQQQPTSQSIHHQVPVRYRRRRSLQQQHHQHLDGPLLLQEQDSDKQRKSSFCSNDNQPNLSSSLSSSCDRHLDKKLSLSTTTSAIGSYTTTNSQLTAADSANSAASGSWPAASTACSMKVNGVGQVTSQQQQQRYEQQNYDDDDDDDDGIIEQDPGTLIQDQDGLNCELAGDKLMVTSNELRQPLLLEVKVEPTTSTTNRDSSKVNKCIADGVSQKC